MPDKIYSRRFICLRIKEFKNGTPPQKRSLTQLLEYIGNEIELASHEEKKLDKDWSSLRDAHQDACRELNNSNNESAGWIYFKLGTLYERLTSIIPDDLMDDFINDYKDLDDADNKNITREDSRLKALHTRNNASKANKELIQIWATEIWKNDISKSIRLTDMCDVIHKTMETRVENEIKDVFKDDADDCKEWIEALKKAIPKKSQSLKPWLREVAPDYAKKPGRPNK